MQRKQFVLLSVLCSSTFSFSFSACAKKKTNEDYSGSGRPPSSQTGVEPAPGQSDSGGKPATPDNGETAPGPTKEPIKLTYPAPDPELGEALGKDEVAIATEISSVIESQLADLYKGGQRYFRDAHPRAHGCFHADFVVDPAIPAEFAHGVFAKDSKYKAIIRFSNASHDGTVPDITPDARGMAIKLLDVPGKKLLESEADAKTQDFIFLSHHVFPISDPSKYTAFIKHFTQPGLANQLGTVQALGIKGAAIAAAMTSKSISSSIEIEYFSMVPYQLGVGADKSAVRYSIKPCLSNGKSTIPKGTKEPYYLRTRLNQHFEKSDACMEFWMQKRTNDSMSVEDSTNDWKSPWSKVATLTMKKEEQDNPATPDPANPINLACDKLSFNPWHALPEHKPLGVMNRIRKVVYDHISKLRHDKNKEVKKEP